MRGIRFGVIAFLSATIVSLAIVRGASAAASLATVAINDPSSYQPFAVGQLVKDPSFGNGNSSYWLTIPSDFLAGSNLQFSFLEPDSTKTSSVQYGLLDFTVTSTGPVWMLTTTRFGGGGNSSGDWIPELTSEAQLEADGWSIIETGFVSGPNNNSTDILDYDLFQLQGTAGQTFSIRTEKYQSPIILQGTSDFALPEPGMMSLIVVGCAPGLLRRRRIGRWMNGK
jgi:hypothetical protein